MNQAHIKRYLLRPLDRRKTLIANQKVIVAALERLKDRAFGTAALPVVSKSAKSSRKDKSQGFYKDAGCIQKQVLLSKALYISRKVSLYQFVAFASMPVETLNEERLLFGENLDNELGKIQEQLDALDKESGLLPGNYWLKGQAPAEFRDRYNTLETQYGAVIESRFIATLREFGLDDLADLRQSDPEEFDRLRERGRRSIFHKHEHIQILKDIVVRHEEEASRAASAKAYTAGVVLIGAPLEGLLLIRCLRSKQKAKRIASTLSKKRRPFSLDDPTKWPFHTLIDVCLSAG